ncbi:MAG: IS630 transposase-related protein [Romboutsia sp.]
MGYDIKFKQRALEYREEGHTFKETCKTFKIAETTLIRWIEKEKEGKLEEVKIRDRKPKKICPNKLVEYIKINPDAYLIEIAENFKCSTTAVLKALKKLNITRKKRLPHTKNNALKK